jgi:hypothetical protein
MNTRRTADYSPTMKGSKAENAAINARREMMNIFASRPAPVFKRRKTWAEAMTVSTGKTFN